MADTKKGERDPANSPRKKEVYEYSAPWQLYGMNWSFRPDKRFRLALGSFVEDYSNKVQIVQLNEEKGEFEHKLTFDHPYPTTKINWIPDIVGNQPDLLATSGDYLRVWRVKDNEVRLECLLNNNKSSEFCAPLTSFDWNETDTSILAASSIDTTCTIWSLEVIILDVRVPSVPVARLCNHSAQVNGITWAPHSSCHICSAGDDSQALIWDIQQMPQPVEVPCLAYQARGEINQVQWSAAQLDWIAICFGSTLEILRV